MLQSVNILLVDEACSEHNGKKALSLFSQSKYDSIPKNDLQKKIRRENTHIIRLGGQQL
jgi:hypothetical protein